MSNSISIFTDGACRGNPGPGGWGVLIVFEGEEITLYGEKIIQPIIRWK